jgi:hypothetical protein
MDEDLDRMNREQLAKEVARATNHLLDESQLLTYPVIIGKGRAPIPGYRPDTTLNWSTRSQLRRGIAPSLPAHRTPALHKGHARPEAVTWVPIQREAPAQRWPVRVETIG